jgi:hypothetical protein
MEKTDIGLSAENGFTVEFEQHAKYTVSGWVLRTHVQSHATAGILLVDPFARRGRPVR